MKTHGCPHTITGTIISGTAMSNLGGTPGALIGSSISSTCPHCGCGLCVEGATGSYMEGTEPHRVDDAVTFFCGSGVTIIGLYSSTS